MSWNVMKIHENYENYGKLSSFSYDRNFFWKKRFFIKKIFKKWENFSKNEKIFFENVFKRDNDLYSSGMSK